MSMLMTDNDRHTVGDLFALVRGYWPEADDEECRFLLWEKTAFPLYGDDIGKYREQLEKLKNTEDQGEEPCSFCNGPVPDPLKQMRIPMCWDCELSLHVRPI